MKTQTKNLLKKLKESAQAAGEGIFNRTQMVAEVLTDQVWVTDQGSRKNAIKYLQAEYFPELSKAISLNHLLTLLEAFPIIEEWEDYNFNLGRLWARYEEERDITSPKTERKTASLSDLRAKDKKVQELQYRIHKGEENNNALKTENDTLLACNRELEDEVVRLTARVEELEKILEESRIPA